MDDAVKSQVGAFVLVLSGSDGIFRYIDFSTTKIGCELTNRCKIPREDMWRSADMPYQCNDRMLA